MGTAIWRGRGRAALSPRHPRELRGRVGLVVAAARYLVQRRTVPEPYRGLRQDIGRAILLGLEFLVAADIIRTVAVAPTLENVFILGGIVLIRTFLSVALQVELEGEWPWRRRQT